MRADIAVGADTAALTSFSFGYLTPKSFPEYCFFFGRICVKLHISKINGVEPKIDNNAIQIICYNNSVKRVSGTNTNLYGFI